MSRALRMATCALGWLVASCGGNPAGPSQERAAASGATASPVPCGDRAACNGRPRVETARTPPLRCIGADEAERAALRARIEATRQRVLDSRFADVDALVDLSLLELCEADAGEGGRAADEAALKDAMRAVAVDGASARPRLALALAFTRSLERAGPHAGAGSRTLALSLLDVTLRDLPERADADGAGAATLAGYVALERGEEERARALFVRAQRLDEAGVTARLGSALAPPRGAKRVAEVEGLVGGSGPLAPARAAPVLCGPEAAMAPSQELCAGLAALAGARDSQRAGEAAARVVAGWDALRGPCAEKPTPSTCGPHVARALFAAIDGFRRAGKSAAAIALTKQLVAQQDVLPGGAPLATNALLESGDTYFELALFDLAAADYERHCRASGNFGGAAALRALALRSGLGQSDAAEALLASIRRAAGVDKVVEARAALAVGAAVRASGGADRARAFVAGETATLRAGGLLDAARALVDAGESPDAIDPACGTPLGCAAKRLAGERATPTRAP